jgi:hypothetical protein
MHEPTRPAASGGALGLAAYCIMVVVSWNWVGTVTTAVVGLTGIAVVYRSGQKQAEAARQLAEFQAEAAFRAQREERRQKRIEAVYPTLFNILAEGADWLVELDFYIVGFPNSEYPPMPPNTLTNVLSTATCRLSQVSKSFCS